ncbi:hypothetical protein [Thermococcus pacificus]|uniref:Uncharacterized protein n=1 Tax=Thermococcus pacificus TaxID=71998 RepID=A0A218P656_9EURY|nr:hypothetical protein [Thermococcus pacificus]ASJ06272.1 hypothetical protein A3L08_02470 [Thermococcus pacificus]
MRALLKIESRRLSLSVLIALVLTSITLLADVEISPIVPYIVLGFLLSSVFPAGLSYGLELILSKPLKRIELFAGFLLSHLLLALIVALPALVKPTAFLYAIFALPFLPLDYLTGLLLKNPRKTFLVGTLVFLILTFLPTGYVDMKVQNDAQKALGIETLADYEAKKAEYSSLVYTLERKYGNYAFFSPGVQLELFARDLDVGDKEDALLRAGIALGFTVILLALSIIPFLRFEPGEFIRPSIPALYLRPLPWWIRKEIAGLWASRAFFVFLIVLLLPVDRITKAFFALFLLPLLVIEVLSENPILILSKPVRRAYLIRRFLVVLGLFALFTPVLGFSLAVVSFTATVIFLTGLFSRKLALALLPFFALIISPALQEGSQLVALLFMTLTLPFIALAYLRAIRMELGRWGG